MTATEPRGTDATRSFNNRLRTEVSGGIIIIIIIITTTIFIVLSS